MKTATLLGKAFWWKQFLFLLSLCHVWRTTKLVFKGLKLNLLRNVERVLVLWDDVNNKNVTPFKGDGFKENLRQFHSKQQQYKQAGSWFIISQYLSSWCAVVQLSSKGHTAFTETQDICWDFTSFFVRYFKIILKESFSKPIHCLVLMFCLKLCVGRFILVKIKAMVSIAKCICTMCALLIL